MTPACAGLRVVAITDRQRMVPAGVLAGGEVAAIAEAFAAAIAGAVAGCPRGMVAVQVREKDLDDGALLALVRAAQGACACVIVNDRLAVALAAGAFGVHLPERGLAIAEARRRAPGLAISVARHAVTAAIHDLADPAHGAHLTQAAAAGADMIQLGTIWPTPSKPGGQTLGSAALAWPHGDAALVAVGGIDTVARAEHAAAAGADAVAVIRAAWNGDSLAAFVAAVERGYRAR